jgi:hypothetical protein
MTNPSSPLPVVDTYEMPQHVRFCVERVRDGEYLTSLNAEEDSGKQLANFALIWLADDRERLLALSTWQPIETAPRKGSILAAYKYDRRWALEVAEWDKKYHTFSGGRGAWIGFGLSGDEESRELNPSHWMPLPAPPTEDTNASR